MYITYSISLPLHLPTSFPISSSFLNLPPLLPFTLQMYLLLSSPQPLPPPPPFVLYSLLSRYHGRPWSGGSDRVLPV